MIYLASPCTDPEPIVANCDSVPRAATVSLMLAGKAVLAPVVYGHNSSTRLPDRLVLLAAARPRDAGTMRRDRGPDAGRLARARRSGELEMARALGKPIRFVEPALESPATPRLTHTALEVGR